MVNILDNQSTWFTFRLVISLRSPTQRTNQQKAIMMKHLPLLLAIGSSASAIELTPENFEVETHNKAVFLKMYAPWCGHCKKIKPDFDKLMEDYTSSESVLIADIDCTADGQPLCEKFGAKGYPTLKYGDPSDLQAYQGGRSYDELKEFVENILKPSCGVKNLDLCSDDEKAKIEQYSKMSLQELTSAVEKAELMIEELEDAFEEEVDQLELKYEAKIDEIKQAGYLLMVSVLEGKEGEEIVGAEAKDEL